MPGSHVKPDAARGESSLPGAGDADEYRQYIERTRRWKLLPAGYGGETDRGDTSLQPSVIEERYEAYHGARLR